MSNKDKIIRNIRKLLALSNSNNENEAHSAMLMAQKLMAKHNIEISLVENNATDHNVIEEQADKKSHKTKWKRWLANIIAINFKCETFLRGYGTYNTIFVGKQENVDICKVVYLSAVRFIDNFFTEYWKNANSPVSACKRLKNSYALGFITRLREKFEEQKIVAEQEGWALVLVKDTDVVKYMEQKNLKYSEASTTNKLDINALRQGYMDCNDKYGETGQAKIK